MQDEQTLDLMGFLVATSADMSFYIDNRQMDQIVYRKNPVYDIYPMDQIPETQEQFMPGFKWEQERRPMRKEDVLTRTIRPTRREEFESLPPPFFPLTDRILRDRDRMIRDGIWRERNDVLSPQALEFIGSLASENQ